MITEKCEPVNLGDLLPGGMVGNTVHDNQIGCSYPLPAQEETHSAAVRYVLKTGVLDNEAPCSGMVVDIGGNCGFCRAYIPGSSADMIWFGWEVAGCPKGRVRYPFEGNSWYAMEQGRLRITEGPDAGKDYLYLKINGETVSAFVGEPDSHPRSGQKIYIEASGAMRIMGDRELRVRYYTDDALFLDQPAQKGFPVRRPCDPRKDGQFFKGWYTQKKGGQRFDFGNTVLTDSICLYAAFTSESVTAVFDPANGTAPLYITTGRGCPAPEPPVPVSPADGYDFVFTGWKNESTGKIFDFSIDLIGADTAFTAQYRKKEFHVSYVSRGSLVRKVPFVMSSPSVKGREPAVPAVAGAVGHWEAHDVENLTESFTVRAVYDGEKLPENPEIQLDTYGGREIDLCTDRIRKYLSADPSEHREQRKAYWSAQNPREDHQNTAFLWTDSGENSGYTVIFADNPEFRNAFLITTEKTVLINEAGIFTPGRTYYWYVCGNDTGACSAVDFFTVRDSPVRFITAGTVSNMRDLGGLMTADGKRVKYGYFYRGAALDENASHIDAAARYVFQYLGMRSEIELRGDSVHSHTGWDENNRCVFRSHANGYQEIFSLDERGKELYRTVFDAMADETGYPFYFHCSAGADRTGTFAFLLYGLLGVPYEDIRTEYELTSFSLFGPRAADRFSADDSLDLTYRRMLDQFGGGTDDLRTAADAYLTSYVGTAPETPERIRRILLTV